MAHQEYLPGTMQSRSMGAKKHVCLNIFVENIRDILRPCDLQGGKEQEHNQS